MHRWNKWFAIILLWPALLLAAAAPDIVLKGLDGSDRNVNEFIGHGQWTVVVVWSADCPICRREIYQMAFFHDVHKNKDAAVLGISVDGYANKAKAQAFVDDQSLNFPNLIGDPRDASRIGGGAFIGTPTHYFFAPDGRFVTQRIGPLTQEQAEKIIRDAGKPPRNPAKK